MRNKQSEMKVSLPEILAYNSFSQESMMAPYSDVGNKSVFSTTTTARGRFNFGETTDRDNNFNTYSSVAAKVKRLRIS